MLALCLVVSSLARTLVGKKLSGTSFQVIIEIVVNDNLSAR